MADDQQQYSPELLELVDRMARICTTYYPILKMQERVASVGSAADAKWLVRESIGTHEGIWSMMCSVVQVVLGVERAKEIANEELKLIQEFSKLSEDGSLEGLSKAQIMEKMEEFRLSRTGKSASIPERERITQDELKAAIDLLLPKFPLDRPPSL